MQASLRPAACLAAQGAGNMKNRQPFPGSVFRAVKKKKQRAPKSTQDLARNKRPVPRAGKNITGALVKST